MRNAGLEEAQAGIKIAGRNINHLRYADDTTLMAESKELKSLLMKVKEKDKVGLKLNIQKTKIMASGPITSWEIDGETKETVRDFIFLGSNIIADGDCSLWSYKGLAPWKKSYDQPERESEVAQLCPTVCDPMDCSLSGSSVHGIFQAKIPEWAAIKSKTENCFLELYNITDKNF